MMITDETLLADIETFLARVGMSASQFGERAAKDRHFVRRLRAGKTVTLRKAADVYAYMRHWDEAA